MTVVSFRAGLAALAAVGGLALVAGAQPPAAPAQPAAPKVVKWPGGYMIMNGSEVIVRNSTPGGGSTNLITGSGNGFGNKIVVSGGAGGTTIVQNARNGIGNRLILDEDDLLIDLDELLGKPKAVVIPVVPKIAPADPVMPPAVAPAPAPKAEPPSYKGKASPFWTKKAFSDAHDCNLYWCPTTKLWFRYAAEDDTYRPVPTQPAAPTDEK
jgi:hypothetical protein